jgi:hypothetical protein
MNPEPSVFGKNLQKMLEQIRNVATSSPEEIDHDAFRISVAGPIQYEIHFEKPDEFELTEDNRRSSGTCRRQT